MITPTVAIAIALFAFLSSFIQRVTGFGYGILFMAVCPYLMPSYGEATALSGMLALVCALVPGVRVFRYIPWRRLVVILLTFLFVSFFAVKIVGAVDNHLLKHVLGVILIVIGLYFSLTGGKIKLKPSVPVQLAMGTLSGMMGGLFGMQGPPAVLYFLSCSDSKEEYLALTQWYFIIGNLFMTFYRARNGFLTATVGWGWLIGVFAVLAGLWAGSGIYRRLPVEKVRMYVYVFIAVSGVVALVV